MYEELLQNASNYALISVCKLNVAQKNDTFLKHAMNPIFIMNIIL
jgi:hypothetical protein